MRRMTNVCGSLVAAVSLGALLAAGPASAAERIHAGLSVDPPYLVHITPFLAQDLGYYKDEGLEVKISGFRGGTQLHQALVGAGSDLDIGLSVPGPLLLTGISKGSRMKTIYSHAAKNEAVLVTAPDIKNVTDLRGRKVAIEGIGGYSHIGFLSVAEPAGLTDKDVTYVRATPPQRLPFLLNGNADAVVIHVEDFYRAQREKPVNELARLWRTQPYFLYAAYAAHEDKLKERRETYVKFLRANIRANRFLYKNKDRVLEVAEKYTKAPRWALDKAYDVLVEDKVWSVNAGLPAKTLEYTNDLNQKLAQYDKGKPAVGQLVDLSLAQEALKSLGGAMGAPFDPGH